jgi:xylose isomerase
MRTYKLLAARAAQFDADPEVRELIAAEPAGELEGLMRGYSPQHAARLRALPHDPDALGRRGLRRERLDQLLVEHLLGAR